ncbi:MAG: Hsp33 family molecular chaperone HslO [Planctomycetota bacterium]
MANSDDHVIREMTDDGAFRVLTLRTTDTVQAVIEAQQVSGATAFTLGEVVTAAVLVRETMAPAHRVQVHYTDPGGGRVIGDAHPEGRTRGLAQVGDPALGAVVRSGGLLEVFRILRAGKGHQGVVETADDDGLDSALARYFARSEQVTTFLRLGVVLDDGPQPRVLAAGGFIVQLLPEVSEPPLARMRARVEALGDFDDLLESTDADPRRLMELLVEGEVHTELADSPIRFGCTCNSERVVASVATLGEQELRDLLARGEELSVSCDYCRTRYTAGPADYRRLLGS